MKLRSPLALALLAALVAGCGSGSEETDDRTASGEILEGSVSDAMIPLERLESQPPLMRERAAEAAGSEAEAGAVDEAAGDSGPGENPLFSEGFAG